MFKEVYITELPDKFPSTSHRNLCIIEESAQGIVAAAEPFARVCMANSFSNRKVAANEATAELRKARPERARQRSESAQVRDAPK